MGNKNGDEESCLTGHPSPDFFKDGQIAEGGIIDRWISVDELEDCARRNLARKSRVEYRPGVCTVYTYYIMYIFMLIVGLPVVVISALMAYYVAFVQRFSGGIMDFIGAIGDAVTAVLVTIYILYFTFELPVNIHGFSGCYYLYNHMLCFPKGDPDGKSFDYKKKRVTRYYCVPIEEVKIYFRRRRRWIGRRSVKMEYVESVADGKLRRSHLNIPEELGREIAEWLREEGYPENVIGG